MNNFKLNELVWVKFSNFPWWPSVIRKEESQGEYDVFFCGDGTRAKVQKANVRKWEENFDLFTSEIDDDNLLFSIGVALKLQEGEFKFKDHDNFIKERSRDEIIKEMREFLNFNQQEIIKAQKGSDSMFLRKKRNNDSEELRKNLTKKDIFLLMEEGKENSHKMEETYNHIIDIKNKIEKKLSRNAVEITPENISSLKESIELTKSIIDKTFHKFVTPYLGSFRINFENINPSVLYEFILSMRKLMKKEELENELNKYIHIYKIFIRIINRIKFNDDDRNKTSQFAVNIDKFVELVTSNQPFEYNGYKFWSNELTNKYIRYTSRKKIREDLLKVFSSLFPYIEEDFLATLTNGIENLLSKIDKKIGESYIENVKTTLEIIKELSKDELENSKIKTYDLSTDF